MRLPRLVRRPPFIGERASLVRLRERASYKPKLMRVHGATLSTGWTHRKRAVSEPWPISVHLVKIPPCEIQPNCQQNKNASP
jgi:hypothetical protein